MKRKKRRNQLQQEEKVQTSAVYPLWTQSYSVSPGQDRLLLIKVLNCYYRGAVFCCFFFHQSLAQVLTIFAEGDRPIRKVFGVQPLWSNILKK